MFGQLASLQAWRNLLGVGSAVVDMRPVSSSKILRPRQRMSDVALRNVRDERADRGVVPAAVAGLGTRDQPADQCLVSPVTEVAGVTSQLDVTARPRVARRPVTVR